MASRPLERYHERTRRRGVNPFVYWPVRWVVKPAILVYFRLRRLGTEHVPDGGVLLASNHRSFLDPFAIGCCIGRPIYFMAKRELFKNPVVGWLLNCLGAFPIKRGASDEESMATALALLERGQAVVIFPEGTRIRTGSLARPKRGVGRLALQSGTAGRPDRRDELGARPPRLADQAGQGPHPLRAPAHLPARGGAIAVSGRRGDRADLALRRAPVGVARRPPAAAYGRGRRRRLDGHGLRRRPRARGTGCPARLPHRRAGRVPPRRAREPALPARRRARPRHRRQDRPRDRVRRRGPGRARRALRQPARRGRRDRGSDGRSLGRARRLQGARAAARHHARSIRLRARTGPRRRHARRARARARGDRAGRLGGDRHPRRRPAPPAA